MFNFVFALADDLFKGMGCNLRRPTFRILVIQPLLTVDFHSFIIFFPCRRTAVSPVNSSFNHTSLVLKGGAASKIYYGTCICWFLIPLKANFPAFVNTTLCNSRLLRSHTRLKKIRPYNHWLKSQGHYLLCFSTSNGRSQFGSLAT